MVFLILDGFSSHITDARSEACVYHGIRILKIPAHTSDQVQPLDIGWFGLHKPEFRHVQMHLDLSAQSAKLIRMFCGFQKAIMTVNIFAAFWRVGSVC
jgi:hypothetical protein